MDCPYCGSSIASGASFCTGCGSPVEEQNENVVALAAGSKLRGGRYSIGKVLGQGGFGITYLGSDGNLKRAVAIKEFFLQGSTRHATGRVVSGGGTSGRGQYEKFRERFLDEARLLAQFNQVGIVRVLDIFEENDTAYIVMEYVKGETLKKRVERSGPLSSDEVRGIGEQLMAGLEVVHRASLLHRDVKPENILIDESGRVVLIDFGAARAYQHDTLVQLTVVATTGFAPPEQYASKAKYGPYTDIYGLCATLYFSLTGEIPPSAADRLLGVEIPDMPGQVGQGLVAGITRGLEIRFDQRPQTIAELRSLIGEAGQPQPMTASGVFDLESAINSAAEGGVVRIPAGIYQLSDGLILLKSIALIGEGREKTVVRGNKGGFVLLFDTAGTLKLDGISFEYQGQDDANVVVIARGTVEMDGCAVRGAVLKDDAGGSGLWLYGASGGVVKNSLFEDNGMFGIDLMDQASPTLEGNTCRRNSDSGIIYRGTSAGVARNNVCENNNAGAGIGISDQAAPQLENNQCRANNAGIAYMDSGGGKAHNNLCEKNQISGILVGDQAAPILEGNTCRENQVVGIGYFGTSGGTAKNNTCEKSVEYHGIEVGDQAAPTLEGNTCRENKQVGIAYFGSSGGIARNNVCERNLEDGIYVVDQATPTLEGNNCIDNKGHGIQVVDGANPVVGTNLLKGNGNDEVPNKPLTIKSGIQPVVLEGHKNRVWSVAFSPDGRYLASGSGDQTVKLWSLEGGSVRLVHTLTGHGSTVRSVVFSADGQFIYSGAESYVQPVIRWKVPSGDREVISVVSESLGALAISRDGNKLAATKLYGDRIWVWNSAWYHTVPPLKADKDNLECVAFTSDGQKLVSGHNKSLRVWDSDSGRLIHTVGSAVSVESVAVTPDGDMAVYTVAYGTEVFAVDIALGKSRSGYKSPGNKRCVAFSPNGRILASGAQDRSISLWDVQTRGLLTTLQGHRKEVLSVCFSPDGRYLASGSADGTIMLWSLY